MSSVIPWEEPIPDCVECKYNEQWFIDFPCRACKVAFSVNKTNYFEQKES